MLEKQISFKHGVSINGELQVYKITKYMEGDEVKHEVIDNPYSPPDVYKMGNFDVKSQQIVEAIYLPEIIKEVQDKIKFNKKQIEEPGFFEIVDYDRMIDDLWRVSIRKVTRMIDNHKVVSRKIHRSWIMPGSDFFFRRDDLLSRVLAEKFHTAEVAQNFKDEMQKNEDAFTAGLNGEAVIQ